MSVIAALLAAGVAGVTVYVDHGPTWAVTGLSLVVLNTWIAADRIVSAIRAHARRADPKPERSTR